MAWVVVSSQVAEASSKRNHTGAVSGRCGHPDTRLRERGPAQRSPRNKRTGRKAYR